VAEPHVVEESPVVVRVPAIELGLEAQPEGVATQEPAPEAQPEAMTAPEAALEAPTEAVSAPEAALEAQPEAVSAQEPAIETRASGVEDALLSAEPRVGAPPPEEFSPPAPRGPEDLTVIEGIGPKISGILQAAGIATFSDLAALEPERVRQILTDADPRLLRLADPATWPRQAGLAAAGKWDELKDLQTRLSGGREG
jgi:small subunit ribosomal protein S2